MQIYFSFLENNITGNAYGQVTIILYVLYIHGRDMICNMGGLMIIAREVCKKFPPVY